MSDKILISKDVCLRCLVVTLTKKLPIELLAEDPELPYRLFRDRWEQGLSPCIKFREHHDFTTGTFPQWCPRKFEHAVALGMEIT